MEHHVIRTAGLLVASTLLGWIEGCAVVGPSAIASGRSVYNEVINRTGDEQLLNMIVRERYGETFGMLRVASVTASMKFRGSVGAEFGFGPDSNYAGNLVPLSAGVAYEENPTISYAPLGGEAFLTKMLAPITVEQSILIGQASDRSSLVSVMIRRINGLENPALRSGKSSPAFDRVVQIHGILRSKGMLTLARDETSSDSGDTGYYFIFFDYSSEIDLVREYLSALGITSIEPDGQDIYLPVRVSIGRPSHDSVNLELRSVIDIIRDVGASIDVPAEHVEMGIVDPNLVDLPRADRIIAIKSSKERPRLASVAIQAHGYWFYIDATDAGSKEGFGLLRTLIGMRLDATDGPSQVPVLTIPTGG
ncbi:MAG: hypothetical protein KDA22_13685 [Phycisphaerales bacterium]|nr:hypothetical protein [Phycisphaerales bacterium]